MKPWVPVATDKHKPATRELRLLTVFVPCLFIAQTFTSNYVDCGFQHKRQSLSPTPPASQPGARGTAGGQPIVPYVRSPGTGVGLAPCGPRGRMPRGAEGHGVKRELSFKGWAGARRANTAERAFTAEVTRKHIWGEKRWVKLKEEARARSKLAFYCESSRELLKSVNLIKQPNCSHYR